MRFRLLAGTVFSTAAFMVSAGVALAQSAPAPEAAPDDDQRDKVTITATRTEKRTDEVPVTVTVIDDKKIEDELVTDIKDLVRFEPGVSVRNSPGRFSAALAATGRDGNSGFNIRGLEGNRVMIQVDGVRVPDGFTFGAQAQGRGDYVDMDLLKSVEILRGPTSALYGSDGISGAVSFVTRDPEDMIREGNAFGLRGRAAYASADDSQSWSASGATAWGPLSAMLAYTRREGHEQENRGENTTSTANRTAPNPTDYESESYLGKLVWTPAGNQRVRLTYERSDREQTVSALSSLSATVLALQGDDTSRRERLTLDHDIDFELGWLENVKWAAYTQTAKTRQFTFEDRTPAVDRTRESTFDNRIQGINAQASGWFETGFARHHWLAGADYSKLTQGAIRSGTVPPAGETFPTRPFPLTDYEATGLFIQDEISLPDGQLVLYPALRYDAYELMPTRDAFYPAALPAAPSDDSHVTPKLGVVAWPVDWFGAYLNYAAGYKAPTASQVNNGFSNPLQFYTSIANPDLKPETSDALEIGVRVRNIDLVGAQWSGSVAGFQATYDDFIEQAQVSGTFAPTDPAIFQYINITEVDINGVEAKIDGQWNNGVGFTAAAAYADGEGRNGAAFAPLQSVDPFKLVAGLTYNDPSGVFGGQAVVTYVDGKKVEDVTTASATTLFLTPDFTILDITMYWNITDRATLRAGAFNVTDQKYWWWGDVRGLSAASATRDAYTQPGANYSASLTLRY